MKKLLTAWIGLLVLAWAANLAWGTGPAQGADLWVWRAEALNLTGILAIGLMSLVMILSTRPAWLERPLGGMDQVYRLHKWAGILAISLGALHWLAELSGDVIKGLIGRSGKVAREHGSAFFEMMRDLGKDMGEWAIYALLLMLVITLWKRFPFRYWRLLHRVMPVLYLMLAVHAAFLAPVGYWAQPLGALLGLLLGLGSLAALVSLSGRIGRRRQYRGTLARVERPAPDVTQVVCQLESAWPGHRPGQFALLTLDPGEGHHPFTIASADQGDRQVSFQIKALGDYTRGLAERLTPGQAIQVEGPYGCFDLQGEAGRRQVWIAGGIGVTPFLAGLEALAPESEVDVWYCTRAASRDPFATRLRELCDRLPRVRLRVRDTGAEGPLTAATLARARPDLAGSEIWFCGPGGFASALRQELAELGLGRLPFHQEAFEMR